MASIDFEAERQAFRDYYNDQQRLLQEAAAFFQSLVTAVLRETSIEIDAVTARVKDREESIQKFIRKYREKLEEDGAPYEIREWVTDLIGVRVVCLYEPDIYSVENLLKQNFALVHESDKKKALEAMEAAFGYKGVHLDLRLGGGRESLTEYKRYQPIQFEVQIRTISQDAWSTLDHKIKYKKNIPVDLKRRINRLAALFELADQEFVNIRDAAKIEVQRGEQVAAQLKDEPELPAAHEAPLDVFGFLGVARQHFPTFRFHEDRSDSFLQEVLQAASGLTASELSKVLNSELPTIYAYSVDAPFNMNPFTMIRHALYSHDSAIFSSLLFPNQRARFGAWLNARGRQGRVHLQLTQQD